MKNARILLVEDDPALAELMTWHLQRHDLDVESTPNGERALRLAAETVPDLILLDWMIEGVSGIEVCRRLRLEEATAKVPIIMVSARGEEADRVRGLQTGADDYVTKPFSFKELVARVQATLRRLRPAGAGDQLRFRNLELDLARHKVRVGARSVSLPPTEFRLLRHFLEHPGRVISRERLLDAVWGAGSEVGLRSVDVHIRRLRAALRVAGGAELIQTVRSAGYMLDDPDD